MLVVAVEAGAERAGEDSGDEVVGVDATGAEETVVGTANGDAGDDDGVRDGIRDRGLDGAEEVGVEEGGAGASVSRPSKNSTRTSGSSMRASTSSRQASRD